ncbi:MAG: lytic transglycosylase domain-containing protein [Acidobacteriota bacterium]
MSSRIGTGLLLAVLTLVGASEVLASEVAKLPKQRTRWRPLIEKVAQAHQVPADLLEALVATESNFNPEAVSRVGAIGLTQLMPATARQWELDDPFDPEGNLRAGAAHLKSLLDRFGDRRLAIAAYNAGAGAVSRAGGVPNYPETRRHVVKVERYLALLQGRPVPPLSSSAGLTRSKPPSSPSEVGAGGRRASPTLATAPPPFRRYRDASGRLVITNLPARESRR